MNTVRVVGTILAPVHFDEEIHTARFALLEGDNRHHVATVGTEQYEMMTELQDYKGSLFICGCLVTFRSHKCYQHHTTIEPLWIARVEDYPEPTQLTKIAAQWESAAMYDTLKQAKRNPNHRPRLETIELPR